MSSYWRERISRSTVHLKISVCSPLEERHKLFLDIRRSYVSSQDGETRFSKVGVRVKITSCAALKEVADSVKELARGQKLNCYTESLSMKRRGGNLHLYKIGDPTRQLVLSPKEVEFLHVSVLLMQEYLEESPEDDPEENEGGAVSGGVNPEDVWF